MLPDWELTGSVVCEGIGPGVSVLKGRGVDVGNGVSCWPQAIAVRTRRVRRANNLDLGFVIISSLILKDYGLILKVENDLGPTELNLPQVLKLREVLVKTGGHY